MSYEISTVEPITQPLLPSSVPTQPASSTENGYVYWILSAVIIASFTCAFYVIIISKQLTKRLAQKKQRDERQGKEGLTRSNIRLKHVTDTDILPHQLHAASTVRSLTSRPTLPELLKFKTSSGSTVNIFQEIGTCYSALGPLLLKDGTGAVTEAIISNHRRDADAINHEILTQWLWGKGKHPVTWSTLIDVLKDIKLSELAEVIQEGFTSADISSTDISGKTVTGQQHTSAFLLKP